MENPLPSRSPTSETQERNAEGIAMERSLFNDATSWEASSDELVQGTETTQFDIDTIGEAALHQFLDELPILSSPRASRQELGAYLKHCREGLSLSLQYLAARTSFSSRVVQ